MAASSRGINRSLLPSVAPAQPHHAMLDPRAVIVAVGALVTALDRYVVVEGVEDEDDLAVAREAGAHFVQGYHCARPMTSEALITWWREHQCAVGAAVVGAAVPAPAPAAAPTR